MKKFATIIIAGALLSLGAQAETIQLTTQNTAIFRGEVNGASITAAQLKLAELVNARGAKTYPIYLVMDSPGGSIIAGDAFIQFAKMVPNLHTVSIFSASMAAGIVEALPGRRLITQNGVLMFHRAKGGFQGQFEEGEVESELAFWKTIVRAMETTNASRMGMTLEAYKAAVLNELWFYGPQAIEAKAADAVVDIKCTRELIATRQIVIAEGLFGNFKLAYSGCPLFRVPVQVEADEN